METQKQCAECGVPLNLSDRWSCMAPLQVQDFWLCAKCGEVADGLIPDPHNSEGPASENP